MDMEKKVLGMWAIVLVIALFALGFSVASYLRTPEQEAGIEVIMGTGNTSADLEGIPIYMGTSKGFKDFPF